MTMVILSAVVYLSIGGLVSDGGGGVIGNGFVRGDANGDGTVNSSDPIFIQNWLFLGGPPPACRDAADANDDGANNIADPAYLNSFLFMGGPAPPAPYPTCGQDPTPDNLTCNQGTC